MVLDGKSPQEYMLMLAFFKAAFLVLCFSCITLIMLLMMLSVILLSMLVILLFTLHSLLFWFVATATIFQIKSDLQDLVNWDIKWLVYFNVEWINLFRRSFGSSATDIKLNGSVHDKKSCFKMLGFSFSSKLDWGSYIASISEIEIFIHFMKFPSSEVAFYLDKSKSTI